MSQWIRYRGYTAPLAPPVTYEDVGDARWSTVSYDGTLFFLIEDQDDGYGYVADDDEDQAIEFSRVMPSCAWKAKETADAAAQLGLTIDQSLVRAFEATHYDTVDSPMQLLTIDEFRELPHAGSLGKRKANEHAEKSEAATSKLKELTVSVAEAIADGTGDSDGLYLNGLAELSDEVAAVLGRKLGYDYIVLDRLHSLSAKSAASLAIGTNATVTNRLIPSKYTRLYLNGISEMPVEVAEVFAKYKGCLHLNGLVALDDAVASLLRHVSPLSLDGVSFLTGTQADALAKAAGGLSLEGLRALESRPLAKVLAKQRLLRLVALSRISDEAAEELAKHKGLLNLDGLGSLTVAVANALARYKGQCLSLGGLRALSDDVAAALGACKSARLLLDGIESLGRVGAESLAHVKGTLRLNGLKALLPETAAGLSRKKRGYLLLNGLTDLPESLAAAFRGCTCDLDLNGVTVLSDAAAVALASTKGDLELNGVTEVSNASADALARKPKGDLRMDGLTCISSIALAKKLGREADPPGAVTNSIGMKLVPLPVGEFLMGSPEACPLGDSEEEFQHRVRITRPFLMSMHQVTQAEYERITGENPSRFKGADLPVEHLRWQDAMRFCEKLSLWPAEQAAGRRYRLPTEAEWEYACRAGTTTPFNTGDELRVDQARFATNRRICPKKTVPVGSYPPNPWGLFGMHGNVWEWTSDWFSADYFRNSPIDDPQGPASGTHHTLRGGSASVEMHECRTTIRGEAGAADGPDENNGNRYPLYGDFGLRVVCIFESIYPQMADRPAAEPETKKPAKAIKKGEVNKG